MHSNHAMLVDVQNMRSVLAILASKHKPGVKCFQQVDEPSAIPLSIWEPYL